MFMDRHVVHSAVHGARVDTVLDHARVGAWADVAAAVALGFNVNARSTSAPRGPTTLHFAASWGHAPTVRLLLSKGADPNAKDWDWGGNGGGPTPLWCVGLRGCVVGG